MAVPLAWPRRQPGTCRECNRRWCCLASRWCCCRRLHSRQNPGQASPARRGEQPTSAETRALHLTPAPLPHAKSCIGNTLRPRTTPAAPRRGEIPASEPPHPNPTGKFVIERPVRAARTLRFQPVDSVRSMADCEITLCAPKRDRTYLINERDSRRVPGTDAGSGNHHDHWVVDQVGGTKPAKCLRCNFPAVSGMGCTKIQRMPPAARSPIE